MKLVFEALCNKLIFQTLKKVRRYLEEQNQNIYTSRGVTLIDPAERGLRIVSFYVT